MFNPYADKWQAEVSRAIDDTKNCKKQYWIHDQLQKAKRDEAEVYKEAEYKEKNGDFDIKETVKVFHKNGFIIVNLKDFLKLNKSQQKKILDVGGR